MELNDLNINLKGHLEILHFDRSNPNTKKFKHPTLTEDILDAFKPGDSIPSDFCKKDQVTNVQKRFRCNVCRCQIESVDALKEHYKGKKHSEKLERFDPYDKVVESEAEKNIPKFPRNDFKRPEKVTQKNRKRKPDITMSLKEKLTSHDQAVVGLQFVQEFVCPSDPSKPHMFKCQLIDCDGAWGDSHRFACHMVSTKHIQSFRQYASPPGNLEEKLSRDALMTWVRDISSRESEIVLGTFNDIEVIEDEERYWIQANRGRVVPRKADEDQDAEEVGDSVDKLCSR